MIQMRNDGRKLSNYDLELLEDEIGQALPAQYRSFLLEHNGGRPSPDSIDIPLAHFRSTDVQVFHGIDTPIESSDLRWNLENVEGCREHELLPIASDSGGYVFMLVLSREKYGQVYYYDVAESVPFPYFVANDFYEFLSKIRAHTPEELAEIDAAASSSDEA